MNERDKELYQRAYDNPALRVNKLDFTGIVKNVWLNPSGSLGIIFAQKVFGIDGYDTEFPLECPYAKQCTDGYVVGDEYFVTGAVLYQNSKKQYCLYIASEAQMQKLERSKQACDLGDESAEQKFEKFV